MALYAQVSGGVIVEIFTPPPGLTISDCFHDSLVWVDITGRDPQPQVGWTATFNGGIWTMLAPVTPTLTPAQQAQNALGTGVQVLSVSQPLLSGTYPIDSESRLNIVAEMVSVAANQSFTDGTTSMNILDTSNAPHTFDIPHFASFATQVGQYVTTLKMIAAGQSNTLPTQPIRII